MASNRRPQLVAAVDTGGTFTDLVARPEGRAPVRLKVPSTPDDPGRAVLDALQALAEALGTPDLQEAWRLEVRHGTTVATNALLEHAVASVIWITNVGFEDILRLKRQNRPDLYALQPVVDDPLLPDDHVLGIEGRIGPEGEVWQPLEDVERWIDRHHDVLSTAEAFAVSLLHAYAHPGHERTLAEALRARFPDIPLTVSHQLAPVFREYERASTVVVNASLAPIMARYLDTLEVAVHPAPLRVMGSDGGLMSARAAAEAPVHTVLSGPAGGVRGAWHVGLASGRQQLLALDMGGTSTDVSVMVGTLAPTDDGDLGGHPLRVPLLPIETVGAGGGSIAFVDAGGVLRVGPRSAGAVPGPACYGRGGTEATVTDAHVVLGRLPHLLGGAMALDVEAARSAVGSLAAHLNASLEDTAQAILAIAEATMARACKSVSLAQGHDPRALSLVAFGGAGGLHACALAEALGCPEVIFPSDPGVLSAEGIVDAPLGAASTVSLFSMETAWSAEVMAQQLSDQIERASTRLRKMAAPDRIEAPVIEAYADCRYSGQTYTLSISCPDPLTPESLRKAFDDQHTERYGHAHGPERKVEWVALRVFARTETATHTQHTTDPDRAVQGPRALSSYSATLWLPEGWLAVPMSEGGWRCTQLKDASKPADRAASMALALEIHRQRISAIAEEMGATLMRAAFSANIKERRDFSCAIFDARGQMVAHAAHIPVHLGATPLSVRAAIDSVPMPPGSQVMLNDPYAGGTHLPDVTVVAPVYLPGAEAPSFYVANRAHHADVGGISPGSLPAPRRPDGSVRSLTLADEGFCVGPTLIDAEARARFADASRTPAERLGDLNAQEAANRQGERQLLALAARFGAEEVERLNHGLVDYAERRMRAVLDALPDGTWRFTDHLDDDGVGTEPVAIPVTIRLEGDQATVDLTASAPVVPGPLNGVRAIAESAVFYVFRALAGAVSEDHGDLPANSGLMAPITIHTRPGTLIHAEPPAAVSAGNVETSQRLVDALFGALAQGMPHLIPGASGGSMNNVLFGGERTPGGQRFVHYETLAVGAGGGPTGPGAHGVHTHMTNTLNTPVEALERAFPVQVVRYALRRPFPEVLEGSHSGGTGIVRAWRFFTPVEVTLMTERRTLAPWSVGLEAHGERGRNALHRADGSVEILPGKISLYAEAGDTLEVSTPCGGHWRPS
ncbi:MAG: hydantoinase B/oxoprolinase family protein [Bradymonadia bacterium]